MKLKIFILMAVIAVVVSTVVILLMAARAPRIKFAPQQQWQETISNYGKTFTLNTNPPLWPNAKGATNGIR